MSAAGRDYSAFRIPLLEQTVIEPEDFHSDYCSL